jgi:hypothetical protein
LNEKQSFSHFLDYCSDNSTENEVEQEEPNTGPTTPYQTFVAIHGGRNRKRCTRIGAVLNEKQSFSNVLDYCSDNSTENEVEQEELNTGPTTPYQTFVALHGGRTHKMLHSHWSRLERETVVKSRLDSCSDNSTENEVEQEELNTGPTTPYQTFVAIHGGRNRKRCTRIGAVLNEKQSFSHFLDYCSDKSTEDEVEDEELNTGPTTPY